MLVPFNASGPDAALVGKLDQGRAGQGPVAVHPLERHRGRPAARDHPRGGPPRRLHPRRHPIHRRRRRYPPLIRAVCTRTWDRRSTDHRLGTGDLLGAISRVPLGRRRRRGWHRDRRQAPQPGARASCDHWAPRGSFRSWWLPSAGLGLASAPPRARRRRAVVAALSTGIAAGYLAQGAFSIDAPGLAIVGWLSRGVLVSLTDPGLVAVASPLTEQPPSARAPAMKAKAHVGAQRHTRPGSARHQGTGSASGWPSRGQRLPGIPYGGMLVSSAVLVGLGLSALVADHAAGRHHGRTIRRARRRFIAGPRHSPLGCAAPPADGTGPRSCVHATRDGRRTGRPAPAGAGVSGGGRRSPSWPGGHHVLPGVRLDAAERDAPGRFAAADGAWERLIAHDPLDWEPPRAMP